MEPEFRHRDAFMVVGLNRDFDMSQPPADGGIGALWDEFQQGSDQISDRVGMNAYGLGFAWPASRPGLYNYTAAAEVGSLDHIPRGWRGREIDAHEYAVFVHPGTLQDLKETVDFIWQEWMPHCGFRRAHSPDFELYDEAFQRDEGHIEIWVPIHR
jgi:AraC family transcriptional regulator